MSSPAPQKKKSLVTRMFRRSSSGSSEADVRLNLSSPGRSSTEKAVGAAQAAAMVSTKVAQLSVESGKNAVKAIRQSSRSPDEVREEANAMCVEQLAVPEPPSLQEALLAQRSKEKLQKAGQVTGHEDPKVLAKIRSITWKDSDNKSAGEFVGKLRPDARPRPKEGRHPEHPYECLVFKGGGAKGSIYPGAIRALEEIGVMPYIKRFAGASAGALVAALLAAGLSSEQLFLELAMTDLQPLVLDAATSWGKAQGVVSKFGMNPGEGLYKHIGVLFYKYLGNADVTFRELYDTYGVELAVAVTNISRASVELLHVKTAPDYPIRKAVRASMSLPVALHPCRDKNIHSVISEDVHRLQAQMAESGLGPIEKADVEVEVDIDEKSLTPKEDPVELYVDGGVLNNYPIDSYDGWWLSMEKDDAFFRKVIGEGGHKSYVERFGSIDAKKGVREINPSVMGFRLASAFEPDAMHSRLGNDALELRVRKAVKAALPNSTLANKYAQHRYSLTTDAQAHYKLDRDLRHAMTFIKALRDEGKKEIAASTAAGTPLPALDITGLAARFHEVPPEALSVLALDGAEKPQVDMAEMLRHHHYHHHTKRHDADMAKPPTRQALDAVLDSDGWASRQIKALYARKDMADDVKLTAIQNMVRGAQGDVPTVIEACNELEELLEAKGEGVMKRLIGMSPKEIGSLGGFVSRMIEAIQMTNDERVQTKENYSRTCMLNTEYVGTMDFKLEDADYYFLWRKGFLSASMWLEKRSKKSTEKKKKVAKEIAKELKKEAKDILKAAGKEVPAETLKPKDDPSVPKISVKSLKSFMPKVLIEMSLEAQIQKVLANEALSDHEKLDVIQRRINKDHKKQ